MNHTPTPWVRTKYFNGTIDISSHNHDLHVCGWMWATDQQEIDADFIVRACNAHDKLVEACQQAYDYLYQFNHKAVAPPIRANLKIALELAREK